VCVSTPYHGYPVIQGRTRSWWLAIHLCQQYFEGRPEGQCQDRSAHAARLNRENYRLKLAKQRAADADATSKPDVAHVVVDAERHNELCPPVTLNAVLGVSNWTQTPSDCPGCPECPHPKSHRKQRFDIQPLAEHMQAKIEMALDALPPGTQQWSLGNMSAKVRHHCKLHEPNLPYVDLSHVADHYTNLFPVLHTIFPVLAGEGAAEEWFEGYCGSELIFHVGHVGAAFVSIEIKVV